MQEVISDCTEPTDDFLAKYGTPCKPIYFMPSFEHDDLTIENAVIFKHGSKAFSVLGEKKYQSYAIDKDGLLSKISLHYAYIDKPLLDDDVFIAYDLEQFFTLVKCGFNAVLTLSRNLDKIQSVITQLKKDGYHHLYLPIPLHHNLNIDGVKLMPTMKEVDGSMLYTDLSKDDDVSEIQAILSLPKRDIKFSFDGGYFRASKERGVTYSKMHGDDLITIEVSSYIVVKADTRDDKGENWGRLLEWYDRDGRLHTQAINMKLFQTDGADLRMLLSDGGVIINQGKARMLFSAYLMNSPTQQKALCVNKVGWYGKNYILPNRVFGHSDDIIVYQGLGRHQYQTKGTLTEWQMAIAEPCKNHNKLVFAICTALAGALIEPLGIDGQGYHFKGKSSKGKTTALNVASSVWGNAKLFSHTWRTTDNALENTAFLHNDGLLVLDEMGQITTPHKIGDIAYMLVNGEGKDRMKKNLINQDRRLFKLILLSSGEVNLRDIMEEIGQTAKLGQEIRIVDIDVDRAIHGVFDSVDFKDKASLQAEHLNRNSKQFYGVAGEAWLEYLTTNYDNVVEQASDLYQTYKSSFNSSDGHIERVAKHFALIATAGELASHITGYPKKHAYNAVKAVFDDWYTHFANKGNYESIEILKQVKAFFDLHGTSRFKHIDDDFTRVNNQAGYFKYADDGSRIYLVNNTVFDRELCKGFKRSHVLKVLHSHKWVILGKNRNAIQHRTKDGTHWLITFTNEINNI